MTVDRATHTEAQMELLFSEISRIIDRLSAEFPARRRDGSLVDSDFAPFSELMEAHRRVFPAGEPPTFELLTDLYSHFVGLYGHGGHARSETVLSHSQLFEIYSNYIELPEEDRSRAQERSDELLRARPRSAPHIHRKVWQSSLPVSAIDSWIFRELKPSISDYESVAFSNGHETTIWKTYGIHAPLVLDSRNLRVAEGLLLRLDPRADPKALSELAKFRQSEMTADILLELLRLGYSSPEQIRRGAKTLGLKGQSRSYFDRIFAGGSALAFAVA